MKQIIQTLGIGLILSSALVGCKSVAEKTGDALLKAGDAANALTQYENTLSKGNPSGSFFTNYTKAYILLLQTRAEEYPDPELMDAMRDSVTSILKLNPNPELEAQASSLFLEIGEKRLNMGTAFFDERAFMWFKAAEMLPGNSPENAAKISELKKNYPARKLVEVEATLAEAADDPNQAIVADYQMNQLLQVMGEEIPEMKALWSKIRAKNLNTYLFYSARGLIDVVDARINKYGILLAIVKYIPSPTLIGVKVWNSTSGPMEFDGSNFRLVDRQGNSYEPATKLQSFRKKAEVEKGKESEQGGLTFKLPKDAEPHYLELTVADGRSSRKYLP